jgi:hypothetical protein
MSNALAWLRSLLFFDKHSSIHDQNNHDHHHLPAARSCVVSASRMALPWMESLSYFVWGDELPPRYHNRQRSARPALRCLRGKRFSQ